MNGWPPGVLASASNIALNILRSICFSSVSLSSPNRYETVAMKRFWIMSNATFSIV